MYSTCYPESLTESAQRAASNASMRSDASAVFAAHHSEYGGGRMLMHESGSSVRFYIGEDHEDNMDDHHQLDLGIDAAAALESSSSSSSGSDSLSLYEEECHTGLQRVLIHKVGPEILALFAYHFGTSTVVEGLSEMMPSIIEDLLHLSSGEPYGVKGANLMVVLGKPLPRSSVRKSSVNSANSSASVNSGYDEAQQDSAEVTTVLGATKLCAETVTTFNLILRLREGRSLQNAFKNWMAANVFKSKQCVVLEPQFTLTKRMLYR